MSVRSVVTSERTKIRSVAATTWTMLLTLFLGVGIGALVSLSFRAAFPGLPQDRQDAFDPLFATFYGLTFGQLGLVVFGVLLAGGEYSSGTIRASLAAVPRRGQFYVGKIFAGMLTVFAVSVVTVLVTFAVAQAALGPYGTSIEEPGVLTSVVGACLYLTLISTFAMGVASMLRSSVTALGILLPILFLGSLGLGNIPKLKTVTQYLPDQAGMVILHVAGQPDDPRFGRDYGPWLGLGILSLWTVAALIGGYLVLRSRDA
jgi:ABC-type transport system involved in multi-copper enzyme maturation permease subunit